MGVKCQSIPSQFSFLDIDVTNNVAANVSLSLSVAVIRSIPLGHRADSTIRFGSHAHARQPRVGPMVARVARALCVHAVLIRTATKWTNSTRCCGAGRMMQTLARIASGRILTHGTGAAWIAIGVRTLNANGCVFAHACPPCR
jgi:hypothetical protein